jgi:5,10-methylenetetrahydrofolate reductase
VDCDCHFQAMDVELEKFADEQGNEPNQSSMELMKTIRNARLSGFRIQVLLTPHIAEPNDGKMDELEKKIAAEDLIIER